jgi:hypothetical protein
VEKAYRGLTRINADPEKAKSETYHGDTENGHDGKFGTHGRWRLCHTSVDDRKRQKLPLINADDTGQKSQELKGKS